MKPRTLEKLRSLQGTVCSIITTAMNRSFDEKIAREHFVAMIEEITPDGIWGSHPYNPELFSFYLMDHIISIHQEAMLDPSNPEHAQMIKEFEKTTGKKTSGDLKKPMGLTVLNETPPVPKSTDGDATFVDIENLEMLAEQSKRQYDAYDQYQSIQGKMLPK